MAKVNITEAAKMAGITRQYLHKKYIKTGLITVERNSEDKPEIDTAEILRVFGKINGDSKQTPQSYREITPENDSKIAVLEAENKLLREQLTASTSREAAAADREKWYQDQIAATTRLLEHRPPADSAVQIEKLQGQVNLVKKEQSWLRRVFGSKTTE